MGWGYFLTEVYSHLVSYVGSLMKCEELSTLIPPIVINIVALSAQGLTMDEVAQELKFSKSHIEKQMKGLSDQLGQNQTVTKILVSLVEVAPKMELSIALGKYFHDLQKGVDIANDLEYRLSLPL